jgi:aspartate aminotransferase-like enzyme
LKQGKLFTLGPVEMFEYTRERPLGPLPYFRTEAFSEVVAECADRLRRLTNAPKDAHVYLLTCSGTGAMEAVAAGCFDGRDRLIAIDGGSFGHRFAEIAKHHGIPHESLKLDFGETLTREALETSVSGISGFTGLLVNLHETSVGRLYDRETLASFCREHGMYFICDAISAFLADPLDFENDGMDALIISSQKALALPPGLSAVVLSDRLYRKMVSQKIRPFSVYFDLAAAEADALRGQTPFTPAVGTILALRERLEHIEAEGGAGASVARTKALAEDFRARISGLIDAGRVALPSHPLSNACTPLVFKDGGAARVNEKLVSEYGIWLNPNGGALADTVLRVGHIGNLTIQDNVMLAEILSDIL